MKFLYFIFHLLTNCPKEDLEYSYHNNVATCKKCGRKFFMFTKY